MTKMLGILLGTMQTAKGLPMPRQQRFKTKYPGVYFIEVLGANGKPERIYYILYRKNGKLIEEKAGRQFQDDMTPARASTLRADRIQGRELSNEERRGAEQQQQDRWTIARLWEEYKAQKSLKGIVTDENRFQKHLSRFADKEPHELSPFDVDRLRVKMLKTHKPATVRNALELLRRIINFGGRKHLCDGLKFVIEMPRVNNLKTEDLNPEQLAALLEAIERSDNLEVANLMRMALLVGMRRSELFRLQWEHIDWDRGFIRLVDPKSGVDEQIPLNEPARALLERHPRMDSPYVFPGRSGAQRVDVKRQVNKIKVLAGLPADFRPLHGLRHVYATMLASSGEVDMFTLQKLLTHKSPTMTQRYAHLRDESLKKASELAGDIIQRAAQPKQDHGLKVVQ
jgi:integrase